MDTIWLSISAGNGPEECAHVAALTLQILEKEAKKYRGIGVLIRIIETEPSQTKGNIRSALIALKGEQAQAFADEWSGVIQWIWRSTCRPHHKRKNWFISIKPYREPRQNDSLGAGVFSPDNVRFETVRSGGPGGQHVNKTETAVRAIHVPTGKSVVAHGERSQLMNKRLALARLASMFDQEQSDRKKQSRSELRHTHWELERGNPIKVFNGETLKQISNDSQKQKG